jgi:hypothetical protein
VPQGRQVAKALQPLGGERGRFGAVEDAGDEVGCQEGELQRTGDVGGIHALAFRDGADAERLLRIEPGGAKPSKIAGRCGS